MNGMLPQACKECGVTEQVLEGGEFWEPETVPIRDGICYACMAAQRDHQDQLLELKRYGIGILSHGGATFEEFCDRLMKHAAKPTLDEVKALWNETLRLPGVYTNGTSYPYKNSYSIRAQNEPELKVGTVLWRRVVWSREPSIPETKFKKERDVWVAFALWNGYPCREVFSAGPGLVCLSKKEIPADWTALKVNGFSRNGRTAFVELFPATREQLLAAYARPCPKCSENKLPTTGFCEGCVRKTRAEADAQRDLSLSSQLGYIPSPVVKDKPFVCRACSPKAPKGRGRCAICKQEYA